MSWPMVKLGDVAPAIPVKNVNFDEDELVWQLNLDQVEPNTGKIIDKVKQPLSSAGSSTHFFNNEHVLYSKLRPYLNKVVVPDELGIATTELVPMKPDQKRLNKEYLAYYLRSKPFVEWVSTQVSGAKMPRVVMSIFWQHEMPLPPLYEQERIVTILDKSDGICQKREQAIKLADDFLRATFLEMFGDPVENPKKLKKSPITELADIITGFAFKSNEYISDSSEAVRLCRGANTLTGYLDWADTKFWPKNKLEKIDNYLIKADDIILAMDRPWISSGLKVCIFPENQRETYLVQRVARFRPHCESYTNYIYSCIKSPAFEKHCCPTETTVPHISPVELKNFEVLIPPDELMVKFHSIVSMINNSLNKMASGDIDSDALFSELSQQAFSGHLKR